MPLIYAKAGEEEGQVDAGRRSVCLKRHLAGSIYLWACGEKADRDEHDPKLSDMFIGWLILLVQGLAFGMLIVLARSNPQDAGSDGGAEFLLASVTGAIYLLMVSTSHDLRAGFSLLVDGGRAGHRAFGAGLLIVYGTMIISALTVLTSTSNDSVSLLLNAVAVLFIADLDEKALKFFSTISPNWRVFWAMEFIGISFSLAQIAMFSFRDSFPLLTVEGDDAFLPLWVVWVLNPTVVTICSYIFSASLHKRFESCSAALETADLLTFSSAVTRACSGLLASLQRKTQAIRREPVFVVVLGVWLALGVYSEVSLPRNISSIEFYICLISVDYKTGSRHSIRYCIGEIESTFLYIINVMLVAGFVVNILGRYCSRPVRISALPHPCRSSDVVEEINIPGSCATESRLPSLLVGLGIGYWVVSLLLVLASYWHDFPTYEPPTPKSVVGYVCLPCFALVSIFMVADTNVFGVTFAAFVKPAVDILLNRRGIVYWVMMAVLRDALFLWVLVTRVLVSFF